MNRYLLYKRLCLSVCMSLKDSDNIEWNGMKLDVNYDFHTLTQCLNADFTNLALIMKFIR